MRAGMGWERWERNSEGMGGVRVFSGGVNDGRGGRRWELWEGRRIKGAVLKVFLEGAFAAHTQLSLAFLHNTL